MERFPSDRCFAASRVEARSFIRHSGAAGQALWEKDDMKRFGVLMATGALGAALATSWPAAAIAGGPGGGVGGFGGGQMGGVGGGGGFGGGHIGGFGGGGGFGG